MSLYCRRDLGGRPLDISILQFGVAKGIGTKLRRQHECANMIDKECANGNYIEVRSGCLRR